MNRWVLFALAALAAAVALAPLPVWGKRARASEHLDEAATHAGSSWRHGKVALWHAGAAAGEEAAEDVEGLGSRLLHPSRFFERRSVSAPPPAAARSAARVRAVRVGWTAGAGACR